LADQKSAQDKKQFYAVKAAMAEEAERFAKMRIEHNEAVRADDHQDSDSPEQIETEDARGCARTHDRWIEGSAFDGKESRRSRRTNIERLSV
jgi:hypothetical protein